MRRCRRRWRGRGRRRARRWRIVIITCVVKPVVRAAVISLSLNCKAIRGNENPVHGCEKHRVEKCCSITYVHNLPSYNHSHPAGVLPRRPRAPGSTPGIGREACSPLDGSASARPSVLPPARPCCRRREPPEAPARRRRNLLPPSGHPWRRCTAWTPRRTRASRNRTRRGILDQSGTAGTLRRHNRLPFPRRSSAHRRTWDNWLDVPLASASALSVGPSAVCTPRPSRNPAYTRRSSRTFRRSSSRTFGSRHSPPRKPPNIRRASLVASWAGASASSSVASWAAASSDAAWAAAY